MPEPAASFGPYTGLVPIGPRSARAFRATDPASGRAVVLRLGPPRLAASPTAAEQFRQDAAGLSALHHENLIRVLGSGQEGEQLYWVQEWFDGPTLAEILTQRSLSLPEAFQIWRGILKGLGAVHQRGLQHRNLHPGAVSVSPDLTRIKVGDFGFVRSELLTGATGTIATGEIGLATLYYLAPEQLEGRPADARADLYSAGVVLHQMLTGRPPGGKFGLPSHLNSAVPAEVDPLVFRCLERDASSRPQSTGEALAALGRLEEALRLRLFSELQAGGRRSPLLWVGLALVVLAALAAFFLVR
jgi:serine/threonine protein kinase